MSETVKEYFDRLLRILNKVRFIFTDFKDRWIVEEVLVTMPKRYDACITTLKHTRSVRNYLCKIVKFFAGLEQRGLMSQYDIKDIQLSSR